MFLAAVCPETPRETSASTWKRRRSGGPPAWTPASRWWPRRCGSIIHRPSPTIHPPIHASNHHHLSSIHSSVTIHPPIYLSIHHQTPSCLSLQVTGGVLACRRWLRGRSLYFSRLLTSRARSRYFFLFYLFFLHVLVFMCLSSAL